MLSFPLIPLGKVCLFLSLQINKTNKNRRTILYIYIKLHLVPV